MPGMTDLGSISFDIGSKKSPGDQEIAELAERQHGVVAAWQLLATGFGRAAIQYRLGSGSLHQLFRGAYAVGHPAVSPRGRIMAAVLACGEEAHASHHAGTYAWGVRRSERRLVDVTVPRSRHGQRGIRLHRVRNLHSGDLAVVDNIPVTSVARTILDQAEELQPHELANLVTDFESRRLFDLRELERTIERNPGRRGIKPLRAVMAGYREPPITRSDAEKLLLRVCDGAGLPRPQTNVIVAGHRVDAVWPEQRLVVEVDSRTHHLTVAAFEEDRRRDADLMLAGYRVLRITWRRLCDEPRQVVATLRALLGVA
jgi:very-short-patch-repair endonuclease